MTPAPATARDWTLLIALSILWGGSFIFIGVVVKELPVLVIVFARVFLAVLILLPVHVLYVGALPRDARTWIAAGGMSIMNNVIPFSLIVYGQSFISAGLAAVINATTPFFAVLAMAIAGGERLTGLKAIGLLLGLAGVAVLKGIGFADFNQQAVGMLCVMLAAASYGVSTLWSKKMLAGVPPLTTSTIQLLISSVIMGIAASAFSDPGALLQASIKTWVAIAALAGLSTALAYLLFFRIIASAGGTFVSLVTMLIPIPAIFMASLFLGEYLSFQEIVGAVMIGLALLVIDGRILRK